MNRAWMFVVWLISLTATGCAIGSHPYDDCGPVWSEGKCAVCNPDYRAGSILNKSGPIADGPESKRANPPPQSGVAGGSGKSTPIVRQAGVHQLPPPPTDLSTSKKIGPNPEDRTTRGDTSTNAPLVADE